jgi:hypothetical protein
LVNWVQPNLIQQLAAAPPTLSMCRANAERLPLMAAPGVRREVTADDMNRRGRPVASGSVFAAWEQPQVFSEELRVGFRSLH